MADINAICNSERVDWQIGGVVFVAHLPLDGGLLFKFIDPYYAICCWIVILVALRLFGDRARSRKCPRCGKPFRARKSVTGHPPPQIDDSCPHCGLRALTQIDIRRTIHTSTNAKPPAGVDADADAAD